MDTSFAISNSALSATQTRHDVTANNVANINTKGFESRSVIQKESSPTGTEIGAIRKTPNTSPTQESNTDFAKEATDMITNRNVYGANGKVIKVQNDMMGEVINLVR